MNTSLLLILRRLRPPLIALIVAYSIAVAGFTLMPGTDDQGETWHMSIFEAFYVVTYTAPTIGFGELPHEFSGAQRLWTAVTIYLTVLAWLYSVGTIISLMQDPTLRATIIRSQLNRSVRQMAEPFWLICGFGDSGRLLVRALTERRRRVVVMDSNPERIDELNLKELGTYIPAFCSDARIPDNLLAAGLGHRWCMGIVAVTDDDHVNLKVAISSKLLNSRLPVFCRAENRAEAQNMDSFGTDTIMDPFLDFADRLTLAIRSPETHRVHEGLSGIPHTKLPERSQPPSGRWIVCGYGRLGEAVHAALTAEGIDVVVVDENAYPPHSPAGTIRGKGTEAQTLQEAGLDHADALLAGTADDADNLSIIMTARALKPDLYVAARENSLHNKALFQAASPDLVIQESYLIASRALSVLNTPLLGEFLAMARRQGNDWNRTLAQSIAAVAGGTTPESWTVRISRNRTPAVADALERQERVQLRSLGRDPRNRQRRLEIVPLMLQRDKDSVLLPEPDMPLALGDRVVFCGTGKALERMRSIVTNPNTLRYVETGEHRPEGWLWRRLTPRKRATPR